MPTKDYYKTLAELPIPTQATFVSKKGSKDLSIQASFSISDQGRNEKRSITQHFTITGFDTGSPNVIPSPVQDANDVVLSTLSTTGNLQAILRDAKDKRFVEVWEVGGATPIASLNVTDIHEGFYATEEYASLSFSASETALVYVAEAKRPPATEDVWAHFRYTPTLGEGYKGKKKPTAFLFKWEGEDGPSSTAIDLPVTNAVPGQLQFCNKDENTIYGTGYEYMSDGRLLGIKGCFNRPSKVHHFTLADGATAKASAVSSTTISGRSPKVAPDGTLVWLEHKTGGAHAGTYKLLSRNPNGEVKTLVDVVEEPSSPTDFPGLYTGGTLIQRPFVDGGRSIIVSSLWRSRATILKISLEDGTVQDALPDMREQSWWVLGTDGEDLVLCLATSPTIPPKLVLLELSSGRTTTLSEPVLSSDLKQALKSLRSETVAIPDRFPTEAVILHPAKTNGSNLPPCILTPHGGPHATISPLFTASNACLALEGYTIASVNYTGSVGFGDKYIKALQGHCGTLDVQDCLGTLKYLREEKIVSEDPKQLFVAGGSHGGFLAAHLIGQAPDTFRAAAIRNPVIVCSDLSNTDIPDWYYYEFGYEADWPLIPTSSVEACAPPKRLTPEMFQRLESMSPIAHVHKVKADVLLHIGGSDKRVAPAQGLAYYHALKGKKDVDVEMLWFEDQGHPLDGVEAARVGFQTIRDWFNARRGGQ